MFPSEFNDKCPPPYGGCNCRCHHDPQTSHIVPCCYPTDEDELKLGSEHPKNNKGNNDEE